MLDAEIAATALEPVGGSPEPLRILLLASGLERLQIDGCLGQEQVKDFGHRIRLTGDAQLTQSLQ